MENPKQTNDQTDLSNSQVNVHDSREVVIGSGNIITRIFHALGRRQFLALAGGLILVIGGGYYGFRALSSGQSAAYVSLSDIQKELGVLADLNADVRARLETGQAELDNWLTKGMDALKTSDYPVAVQYLEKVAEQAPLATVRQNLAYAYEQLGNADKARENLEAAKKINPNLDTSKSYAQLKGKRINLIVPENGGTILASSGSHMQNLSDGRDDQKIYGNNNFAVWSFKDKRTATFSQFTYLVPGDFSSQFTVVELSYSNNSPTGPFTTIGRFQFENALLTETPFQEVNFPAVTAKYFKAQLLETSPNGFAYEARLVGELQ